MYINSSFPNFWKPFIYNDIEKKENETQTSNGGIDVYANEHMNEHETIDAVQCHKTSIY